MQQPNHETLKRILTNAKTIAVVGLSDKPNRTSYQVTKVMQNAGYKIIPVNPTIEEALGEKAVASLADISEHVDIVNVFRRSNFLEDITKAAIEIDADLVWAQMGVYDGDVFKRYQDQIEIVMDTCIKVAYYEVMR